MKVEYEGRDDKLFQEMLGKGGMTMSVPRREKSVSPEQSSQSHLVEDSPAGIEQSIKQIFQEAREQMSGDSESKTEE